MDGKEKQAEIKHLKECLDVIRQNIKKYSAKWKEVSAETKEMYDQYRSSDDSLHNDLVVGLDLQSQLEQLWRKNEAALGNPYFGRIDYTEDKPYRLYIGKNGIRKNLSEVLIVDWRAPIATVYYDGDVGECSYRSPLGEDIPIHLHVKRTFEIREGTLIDYYDTDIIANDEFLTKYLSQNKNVVLGEIISTIQKEQNQVIRDAPWHSVIVQGVAGSGKTTVAMHRISYLLYNHKERFKPQEFYIIGSNKMLLNYITGVLPNLDVYGVNQMTMEELLWESLEGDFVQKKKGGLNGPSRYAYIKGRASFALDFEEYYQRRENEALASEPVCYRGNEIYGICDIRNFLSMFKEIPLEEKVESLNARILNKILLILEKEGSEKKVIREEGKQYKTYFEQRVNAFPLLRGKNKNMNKLKFCLEDVYEDFLYWYAKKKGGEEGERLYRDFQIRRIDLMDLAMLNLIKRRLKRSEGYERISHMVVDEAQDFGSSIFYVLKKMFKDCTYTIMGDVSQNIHYDTGMNDWQDLRNVIFNPDRDKFYVLAKSYRNTVEISNYASNVLQKCSFETYRTEPVIRHGREVEVIQAETEGELMKATVSRVKDSKKRGYETIAVICYNEEEADSVRSQLKEHVTVEEGGYEEMVFTTGVMVLPIRLTKGLEFDSVVLWNPDKGKYPMCDANGKLLYVAITRALHECYIVYKGKLSELLER